MKRDEIMLFVVLAILALMLTSLTISTSIKNNVNEDNIDNDSATFEDLSDKDKELARVAITKLVEINNKDEKD